MDRRDDAAPEQVDEDKTCEVQAPPLERWVDLIRGRGGEGEAAQ